MKIAILGGTGALGKGLATRWIKSKHEIIIGSRKFDKAQQIAQSLGLDKSSGNNYVETISSSINVIH